MLVNGKQALLEISSGVTFVTSPQDEFGFINYLEGVNREFGQGVNIANNAAYDYLRLAEMEEFQSDFVRKVYLRWGDQNPPAFNVYLEFSRFLENYHKDNKSVSAAELLDVTSKPWKATEYPLIVSWLDHLKPAFQNLRENRNKNHYWVPFINSGGAKTCSLTRDCQQAFPMGLVTLREATRSLIMLNLGEQNFAEVAELLLDQYQRAHWCYQAGSVISFLIGISLEMSTIAQEQFLLNLCTKRTLLNDYMIRKRAGSPSINFERIFNVYERCYKLDLCQDIVKYKCKLITKIDVQSSLHEYYFNSKFITSLMLYLGYDYKLLMSEINRCCDLILQDLECQDFNESAVIEPSNKSDDSSLTWSWLLRSFISKSFRSKWLAKQLLTHDLDFYDRRLIRRILIRRDLAELSYAIRCFQLDQGVYPLSLDSLKPVYLQEIPLEPKWKQPYQYRPCERGYHIYSIGDNGIDEGGREFTDNPSGDDIKVAWPLD